MTGVGLGNYRNPEIGVSYIYERHPLFGDLGLFIERLALHIGIWIGTGIGNRYFSLDPSVRYGSLSNFCSPTDYVFVLQRTVNGYHGGAVVSTRLFVLLPARRNPDVYDLQRKSHVELTFQDLKPESALENE